MTEENMENVFDTGLSAQHPRSHRSANEVIVCLARIIAEICGVDAGVVTPERRLFALGLDSIRAVEVVAALEDTFGITIDETSLWQVKTVEDLVRLVDQHRHARACG